MAENTILATARAADTPDDEEATKAELQRRMEQARETITQTVTEIKDTVANQYQSVRETINETLDWREQFRKRPVAFSVGALSVGFLVGYGLAGVVKGDGGERAGYPSYDETDVWNVGAPLAAGRAGGQASATARSYASQAITGGAYGSTEYSQADAGEASQPSEAGALSTADESNASEVAQAEQPTGPSLYERFKETKAFDRLQDEVSKLGDRFIEQLSTVGQEVVLPALFAKLKDLIGVDLSGKKQQGQQRPVGRTQSASASPSSSLADASRGGTQEKIVSDLGSS
jgi:ElaB/YqjD/DUF883 family membrane-anchored ribosome-binding protein